MTSHNPQSLRGVHAVAILSGLGLGMVATGAMAAGCGTKPEPGRYDIEVMSGGKARVVSYFVPSTYKGDVKVPAVFDFHGSTSTAHEQLARSEWQRVAEREGFIAVAPQGLMAGAKPDTYAWNVPGVTKPGGPDDMAFIKDAIAAVSDKLCIDNTRTFATGYSGGGRVVSQYICNGNTDFAAAGFVVGLRAGYPKEEAGKWQPDAATCMPKKPLPLIAFAGKADKINPYEGGGLPYWQYGAEAALKRWVELDGCKTPDTQTTGDITKSSYTGCDGNAKIVSYTIVDGGHTWPSSTALLQYQSAVGKVSYSINATDEIWAFFKSVVPK